MRQDQTFAEDYLFEILEELPGGSSSVEYIGEKHQNRTRDGVMLEFLPGSKDLSWTAVFAFGDLAARGLSGVYVMPDQRVLVVARGTGYVADPARVREPEVIKPNPIFDVVVVPESRLLLVADRWSVFAFGDSGEAWNTGRIALDGLALKSAGDGVVRGEVYLSDDESRSFVIELDTGKCDGVVRLGDR